MRQSMPEPSEPSEVAGERPVRLVSWDVDGTLYSRSRLVLRLLRDFDEAAFSALRKLFTFRNELETFRRSQDVAPEAMAALRETRHERNEIERRFIVPALRRIGPHSSVVRAIQFLEDAWIPQVVFSDYASEHKLRALELARYFDAVYAAEALGALKPSAVGLERIAQDYGVEPGDMLHIGDRRDTDGAAAESFGCRFLLFGRTSCPPSRLEKRLRSYRFAPRASTSRSPSSSDKEEET